MLFYLSAHGLEHRRAAYVDVGAMAVLLQFLVVIQVAFAVCEDGVGVSLLLPKTLYEE